MMTGLKNPVPVVNGMEVNTSIPSHTGNYKKCTIRDITEIVVHYTGNKGPDTAKGNCQYFAGKVSPVASAHYFVDDKNIYLSVPVHYCAWHAGNDTVSARSIGIEMCCTAGNYKVSDKTKQNAVHLIVALLRYFNLKEDAVKRHFDITGKLCPAQMSGKNNAEWNGFIQSIKDQLYATTWDARYYNKELKGKYKASKSLVYFRKSPNGEIIRKLNSSDIVYNYGYYDYNKDKQWLYVTLNGSVGFVNADRVRRVE